MIAEHLAVVAGEDDERVVRELQFIESLQDFANPFVGFRDHAVVDGLHLLHQQGTTVKHALSGLAGIGRVRARVIDARRRRDALRRIHAVIRLRHDHRRMRRTDGNGERERAALEPLQRFQSVLHGECRETVFLWHFEAAIGFGLRAFAGILLAVVFIQLDGRVDADALPEFTGLQFALRHVLIEPCAECITLGRLRLALQRRSFAIEPEHRLRVIERELIRTVILAVVFAFVSAAQEDLIEREKRCRIGQINVAVARDAVRFIAMSGEDRGACRHTDRTR